MLWTIVCLFPPVFMLTGLVFTVTVVVYVNGFWMALIWFMGFRVWSSRCPRCDERFHATFWWYNYCTRRCLHCQLSLKSNTH